MIDFKILLIFETLKKAVKPRLFYNFNMPKTPINANFFVSIIHLKTEKSGLKQSKIAFSNLRLWWNFENNWMNVHNQNYLAIKSKS